MDSENSRADRLGRGFKALCAMRSIRHMPDRTDITGTDSEALGRDPAAGQGAAWKFPAIEPDRLNQENICNFPVIIQKERGSWGLGLLPGRISKDEQKGKV